jgi:transcription antitermination factor NusG
MSQHRAGTDTAINQISETEARWFAVYTKFKCEKFVAQHLAKKQIEAYVPLIAKTKRYARKIKHYEVPLINCYVFVHITKKEYVPTLETEYVMKFLRQGKDLLAIPQSEIDLMRRVAGDIEEIYSIEKSEYVPGEKVEVISGYLSGLKGRIISKTGKRSFVVDLETLGYQLQIRIDQTYLRPTEIKSA